MEGQPAHRPDQARAGGRARGRGGVDLGSPVASRAAVTFARERLRELESERDDEAERAELRRQLVERLRTGEGIDVDAAYEVREHGWIHR